MFFRRKIKEPDWGNRAEVGAWGEEVAARYIEKKGYKIVARHWTHRIGEIDIVAAKDGRIVFAEVKTRTSRAYGTPEEGIHWYKQQRLARTANVYMLKHKLNDVPYQIDSIAVMWDAVRRVATVRHLENVIGER